MARKKNTASSVHKNDPKAYIEHAGEVVDQKITDTLEKNYMPLSLIHIFFGKMGHSERYTNGLYLNVDGDKDQKMFAGAVSYFRD